MDRKTLATKIAQVRIAKNLSAYELSLRIGKSTNYMHMVESGKVNISIDTLFEICKALEIKPSEIFAGKD
jgi:DNA-binding Xre family transcriptional regulator